MSGFSIQDNGGNFSVIFLDDVMVFKFTCGRRGYVDVGKLGGGMYSGSP